MDPPATDRISGVKPADLASYLAGWRLGRLFPFFLLLSLALCSCYEAAK